MVSLLRSVSSEKALQVLLVEHNPANIELCLAALGDAGYAAHADVVASSAEFLRCLSVKNYDVVLSAYYVHGWSGMEAFHLLRDKKKNVPFLLVTEPVGDEIAVSCVQQGVTDYILKEHISRLPEAVERAIAAQSVRRAMEKQLRQAHKFEAIGKLAGGISHDFNNVIGAVLGWAELGVEQAPPDSRLQMYFNRICDQAKRATGLTRQLLAFAKRQILEPQDINLNSVVTDVLSMLEKAIGKNIEIKTVLSPDLATVRADRSQLEQVLMNLCLNARDAMPSGGQLVIETGLANVNGESRHTKPGLSPGQHVALTVSDNGTGMDAATREHIFEPFFTTKEPGKGTGLGLATVFGIVTQHEGHVSVESDPGRGTTFHIYLPAVTNAANAREETMEPSEEALR